MYNYIVRDLSKDYYKMSKDELMRIIHERRYPVKVPQIAVVSEKYMEIFGPPMDVATNIVTGESREIPRHEVMVSRNFTIAQILEVYRNGYSVDVVNKDLVKEIFYICDAYLYLNREEEYVPNAVVEDKEFLEELDALTKNMSETAKYTIKAMTYKKEESVFLDEEEVPRPRVIRFGN